MILFGPVAHMIEAYFWFLFHESMDVHLLMLLTVFQCAEYRFVLVEKTKSAKNIWELVIVKLQI